MMFETARRRSSLFSAQNFWLVQNAVSATNSNDMANKTHFFNPNINNDFASANQQENCVEMEEAEPLQFCNMKENILRLEELAKKNGISLDDDRIEVGGQNLFQELCNVNPRARFVKQDSFDSSSWLNVGRRFSGLKPEHVPEENKLAQLVRQFSLEHVSELPVLPTEAINTCLLAR